MALPVPGLEIMDDGASPGPGLCLPPCGRVSETAFGVGLAKKARTGRCFPLRHVAWCWDCRTVPQYSPGGHGVLSTWETRCHGGGRGTGAGQPREQNPYWAWWLQTAQGRVFLEVPPTHEALPAAPMVGLVVPKLDQPGSSQGLKMVTLLVSPASWSC
jgi:hypothetical protein